MKTVLLAFDGLAKSDIEKGENGYILSNMQKDYFSQIDLGDRPYYFTSELFTDLYTGYRHTEHGVRGLEKHTDGRRGWNPTGFEQYLQENLQELFFHSRTFRNGMYKAFLGSNLVKWEREDIQMPTIFEEYDNISQGQMPVWDWRKADPFHNMEKQYRAIDKTISHMEDEWNRSKRKCRENLDSINWQAHDNYVYVHHFHYIDWLQHIYSNTAKDEEEFIDILSDHWWNVNEFVQEVEDRLPEDVRLVVMSDHGRPLRYEGHEPDAFISCSEKLFPDNPSLQEVNFVLRKMLEGKHDIIDLEEREMKESAE